MKVYRKNVYLVFHRPGMFALFPGMHSTCKGIMRKLGCQVVIFTFKIQDGENKMIATSWSITSLTRIYGSYMLLIHQMCHHFF
jgi:hypothetical protein